MDNKTLKPSVFPSKEQINTVLSEKEKKEAYEAEKLQVTDEIYTAPTILVDTPMGHANAVEMMRIRTMNQINSVKENGFAKDENLAETPTKSDYNKSNEELMRLRDAQLKKNQEDINTYQLREAEARNRNTQPNKFTSPSVSTSEPSNNYYNNNNGMNNQPPTSNNNGYNVDFGQNPSNIDPYILELSQPNYNAPFDVIALPSKGKLYRNKKQNVRLAYMTTADENILTSPNLLQSGEFLEILINRKILDPNLRYKDLLPGDRNAIMIWLRATGYGEMYPVSLLDENGQVFDTEINLNELKTIELDVSPDDDGLFSFELPLSKAFIRFKLLTCGDVDMIEDMNERDKENNALVNNSATYRLERMVVEVNGSRDRGIIRDFVNSMRISDAKKFNEFVDSLESGIDLNIDVQTPGGGSIATFLPLNINFFWPDIRL